MSDSSAAPAGRWSLRRRLAVTAGLTSALVLAATAAVVFLIARTRMIADHDRLWQARGESVAAALEYDHGSWSLEERPETMAAFAGTSADAAYEIWVDGTVVARSPSLAGDDLPRIPDTMLEQGQWSTLPDGRLGRTIAWTFVPERDPPTTGPAAFIVVVAPADDLHHAIGSLAWLLLWATVSGGMLSAALMALVADRAMRPLRELGLLLAQRSSATPQAVVLADPPRELAPVVARLNEAFARLEAAIEREKGFTADAAHELRTPLAALRLLLEVSLSEADPPDARRQDVSEAHALALRLQRLVDALLALARLDRGLVACRPESVDLGALVAEVWAGMAPAAEARGITLHCTGLAGLAITTDRDLTRQILVNLCDNAVSHGDLDQAVVITASTATSGGVVLTIANEATGAPADLSSAGQRLWRGEAARTGNGRHVGIGLSLCQRFAAVLTGHLHLARQGTRVSVSLHLTDLGTGFGA